MCGLVGTAGDLWKDDVLAFSDLLYVSGLRGARSTGVASCKNSKGKNFDWVKMTSAPLDLIETKRYDQAVNISQRLIMGHTRAPTVGAVSNANAQPFLFKNVVGAHNGTLTHASQKSLPGNANYETDSEALYDAINELGIDKAVRLLEGAWALTFFDIREQRLCFLRNKERTLSYCYSKNRKRMFWASEPNMLRLCLGRHGIDYDHKIYACDENVMYSWDIPQDGGKMFGEPHRKAGMTGYQMPYMAPRQFATDDHYGDNKHHGVVAKIAGGAYQRYNAATQQWEEVKDIKSELRGSAVKSDRELMDEAVDFKKKNFVSDGAKVKFYKGWNGTAMDRETYLNKTKGGCGWCTAVPTWPKNGNPDIVRFVSPDEHFCWSCMHDDNAKEAVGLFDKKLN